MNSAPDFMRIQDGKNPLDATGVHPESYEQQKNSVKTWIYHGRYLRRLTAFHRRSKTIKNWQKNWKWEKSHCGYRKRTGKTGT